MSTWRRKAIEFLPDERTLIQSAERPMELWGELVWVFSNAFSEDDEGKIRKILDNESGLVLLKQCVLAGNYEDITDEVKRKIMR